MTSRRSKAAEAARMQKTVDASREGSQPLDADTADNVNSRIPPIVRAEPQLTPEREQSELPPEVLQPDLTAPGTRALHEVPGSASIRYHSGKKNSETRHAEVAITAASLEGMTDAQIKEAGLLTKAPESAIHPARIASSSERPRTPMQKSPAAGPGSWPVPEDALPAAMPSDPPDRKGSNTLAGVAGIKVMKKDGDDDGLEVSSTRAGSLSIRVPRRLMTTAANLYMQLRQQHHDLTPAELREEFYIQLSGMAGVEREDQTIDHGALSQQGQTAAGDSRVTGPGPVAEAAVS